MGCLNVVLILDTEDRISTGMLRRPMPSTSHCSSRAWKAWRDANIIRPNLSGADLSEVNLSDTDLTTEVPAVGD